MLDRNILPTLAPTSRAAGSGTGNAAIVDIFTSVSLVVDLQSVSGSPSSTLLTVKLQYSPDTSGTRWFDVPDSQLVSVSVGQQSIFNVDLGPARRIRASYSLSFVGGTSPEAVFGADISLQKIQPQKVTQKVAVGDRLDQINDHVTTHDVGATTTNITTNTTTVVKSGAGVLRSITINNPADMTVTKLTMTIYNNTAASGTKIRTLVVPISATAQPIQFIGLNEAFSIGLTVVTAGPTVPADVTINWE